MTDSSPDPIVALRAEIATLGASLGPGVRDATTNLYLSQPREAHSRRIVRDLAYGTDSRHRLDIHRPHALDTDSHPVFCYVHGGGFVGGDKNKEGLPYYDNIGQWAASNGLLGINITYRVAPEFAFPAGAEDVLLALDWIRDHVHEFGGDRTRIVLMGHSAGASHVATALATMTLSERSGPALAGAVLSSGVYDPSVGPNSYAIYYGEDRDMLADRSSVPGLCKSKIPLLISSTELDPVEIKAQTFQLVSALMSEHGIMPEYVLVDGHNHYSVVYQFGTRETWFSDRVLRFVRSRTDPIV